MHKKQTHPSEVSIFLCMECRLRIINISMIELHYKRFYNIYLVTEYNTVLQRIIAARILSLKGAL